MIEILHARELPRARATGALVAGILQDVKRRTTVGTNLLDVDAWAREAIAAAGAQSCYVDYAPSFGRGPVRPPHLHLGQRRGAARAAARLPRWRTATCSRSTSPCRSTAWSPTRPSASSSARPGPARPRADRGDRAGAGRRDRRRRAGRPDRRPLARRSAAVLRDAGYRVNTDFGGHGVGSTMHQDPHVPNDGRPGAGYRLRPGLLLALEPWVMADTDRLVTDADGWTLRSATGCRTAHSEHTDRDHAGRRRGHDPAAVARPRRTGSGGLVQCPGAGGPGPARTGPEHTVSSPSERRRTALQVLLRASHLTGPDDLPGAGERGRAAGRGGRRRGLRGGLRPGAAGAPGHPGRAGAGPGPRRRHPGRPGLQRRGPARDRDRGRRRAVDARARRHRPPRRPAAAAPARVARGRRPPHVGAGPRDPGHRAGRHARGVRRPDRAGPAAPTHDPAGRAAVAAAAPADLRLTAGRRVRHPRAERRDRRATRSTTRATAARCTSRSSTRWDTGSRRRCWCPSRSGRCGRRGGRGSTSPTRPAGWTPRWPGSSAATGSSRASSASSTRAPAGGAG